jgi:hypothetical protein
VQFRDEIPYEAPSSLSALQGPSKGMLEVPITVHCGPSRVFDMDEAGQRPMVWRVLVREGNPQVQEALLNEMLLRQEWGGLILPEHCRALWEGRFPELVA